MLSSKNVYFTRTLTKEMEISVQNMLLQLQLCTPKAHTKTRPLPAKLDAKKSLIYLPCLEDLIYPSHRRPAEAWFAPLPNLDGLYHNFEYSLYRQYSLLTGVPPLHQHAPPLHGSTPLSPPPWATAAAQQTGGWRPRVLALQVQVSGLDGVIQVLGRIQWDQLNFGYEQYIPIYQVIKKIARQLIHSRIHNIRYRSLQ